MKRMPKFGSRYGFKKFEEGGPTMGGPTSYADSGSAGGSNISFKDAFREARKQGLETFTWRGKKYTTELKEKNKPKEEEKTATRKVSTEEFAANMNARLGSENKVLPDSYKPRSSLRGSQPDLEEKPKAFKTSKDVTSEKYSGISKSPKLDSTYEKLAKGRKPGYRATPSYKQGGAVKSSASRRADGIAKKGKTRGKIC